jgi:hypothetical protein
MASIGEIKTAQATISSATDTALIDISAIAGTDSSSFIEVLELYVSTFVAASASTIRFEQAAGGTLIAAFGCESGATIGDKISRDFGDSGWRLPAGADVSVETINAATFYVAVKYRLVL